MTSRRHLALLSILVLICGLAITAMPYVERASYFYYDFLQRHSQIEHDDEVQLILLDQQSIDQMSITDGINYPWPREYYGVISLMAKEFGAKILFFDFLFTEPSAYGHADDERFSSMIKESGIATFFPAGARNDSIKPPIAELAKNAKGVGAVHFKSSDDGVYRKVPSSLTGNNGEIKSISYLLAHYLGHDSLSVENAIHFYKNPLSATPFYLLLQAYHQLQLAEAGQDHLLLKTIREKLKNKIWMVGASAPGLMDLRPTPIRSNSSGVSVHASSLLNLLRKEEVRFASFYYYFLIAPVLLFLLGAVIFQFKRPLGAIVCSFSFSAILPFLLSSLFFVLFKLWLNPLVLLFALFLQMIVLLAYRFQQEWLTQMRISKSLEHTMSHEMLDLVKLGGFDSLTNHQHRDVTILFSDIADFTTISELLDPDQLAKLLNGYFDEVVSLIFENHGYVDKFVGDAVMAVWGAPLNQVNHARLALNAAREYHRRLELFNQKMRAQDPLMPIISARVGVHSGEVVAGNIGSSRRFNYTFIGDNVNLASRLEALSKKYHLNLLFSRQCVLAAGVMDDPYLLHIDRIAVKGKDIATDIYTFITDDQMAFKQSYLDGLDLYFNQSFKEASIFFSQAEIFPAAQVLLSRCDEILKNGIPKNYHHGVWCYDSK